MITIFLMKWFQEIREMQEKVGSKNGWYSLVLGGGNWQAGANCRLTQGSAAESVALKPQQWSMCELLGAGRMQINCLLIWTFQIIQRWWEGKTSVQEVMGTANVSEHMSRAEIEKQLWAFKGKATVGRCWAGQGAGEHRPLTAPPVAGAGSCTTPCSHRPPWVHLCISFGQPSPQQHGVTESRSRRTAFKKIPCFILSAPVLQTDSQIFHLAFWNTFTYFPN